jgi:hypothetical protein
MRSKWKDKKRIVVCMSNWFGKEVEEEEESK